MSTPFDAAGTEWEMVERIGRACAVAAAVDTGLLGALAAAPRRVDELAAELELDADVAAHVVELLVAEGLVARADEGYVWSAPFASGLARMPGGTSRGLPLWAGLERVLRRGTPAWVMDADLEIRASAYRDATPALGEMFAEAARELAPALVPAQRVLDLGCGSGVWSLALALEDPACRVVGVDYPPVLDALRARAAALGVLDRVEAVGADLLSDPLPLGFDVVIVANVLRLEPAEVARALVIRAAEAVLPGGKLVVVDALGDAAAVALYGLTLHLRTRRGRVHARARIEEWLEDAGMQHVVSLRLASGPAHLGVLVARRQCS